MEQNIDINQDTFSTSQTKNTESNYSTGLAPVFFVSILSLIFIGLQIVYPNGENKNFKQQIVEIFKQKPSVTYQETLTGIDFYIECNDNYSYIELKVNFYDNYGNIIDVITLTGNNCKKGNTYTLSYKINSLSDLADALKAKKFSYEITEYK